MQGSRLLNIIQRLEKHEIRELRLFLRSPYFNQREDVVQAFDFIIERVFDLKIIPSKEDLVTKIYPEKAVNLQQARYLMSWLLKLIEQYLSISPLLQDKVKLQIQLAGIYRERRLDKHFTRVMKDLNNWQREAPTQSVDYYEQAYHIQLEEYYFTSTQKRLTKHNLQTISDHIDIAYLIRKLRHACLLLSHQSVYQMEYDFGLLNLSLAYIKKRALISTPAIAIYYHCYYALSNPNEEHHFLQFKQLLLERGTIFPERELRDLYLLAINYCIRSLNAGNERYALEGLDLYKAGFESQILLLDGKLSRFTYRNVVAMALKEGELEWAQHFIHQYRPFLDKAHQESMYSFSLARLAYRKKAHGEVLELLQKAEYQDPLLNLAAKTMLLKVYFELQEFDLLQAHLEAMKSYINRKRIIGYHRTNYLNMIRYARKLSMLNEYDKQAIPKLKQQLAKEEILTEREWFLAQL